MCELCEMSYDSDPELWPFSTGPDVCNLCYDVGETPDPTIATFSGIQEGDDWTSGDPPPPNGSYILPAIGLCSWRATFAPWTVLYKAGIPSDLEIEHPTLGIVFIRPFGPSCRTYFINSILGPIGNKYFGGWGTVIPQRAGGPQTVSAIMDLLGIPASKGTFVSPRPMTSTQTVYVFARDSDASNLHIKINTP